MTWILAVLALSLLLVPLGISIRRSTELFKVKVREGRTRFIRGRMPQSLLTDFDDVVRSPRATSAEIRAVRRGGRAHLEAKGDLTPEQRQRLRNILGSYSLQRILAGGSVKRR